MTSKPGDPADAGSGTAGSAAPSGTGRKTAAPATMRRSGTSPGQEDVAREDRRINRETAERRRKDDAG